MAGLLPRGGAGRGGVRRRGIQGAPTRPPASHPSRIFQFDAENDAVVTDINDWNPDILIVGMGMPRQERWVLETAERLDTPAILTCGATIEYFAGTMATPPRWTGRWGLEWLGRLLAEPGRLWKRYLLEPWTLLPHAARDIRNRIRGG